LTPSSNLQQISMAACTYSVGETWKVDAKNFRLLPPSTPVSVKSRVTRLGEFSLGRFFQNCRSNINMCYFFPRKELRIILLQKWVGLNFGRFFRQLNRSPWLRGFVLPAVPNSFRRSPPPMNKNLAEVWVSYIIIIIASSSFFCGPPQVPRHRTFRGAVRPT
jgi:hypothetical protein